MSVPLTILITGASSGIGRELALLWGAQGHRLVLVARRLALLEELKAEVTKAGGEAILLASDLSLPEASQKLAQEIANRQLELDILVNNAGFGAVGAFEQLSRERQVQMIQLNITVLTELTHLLLPAMRARRRGQVVNVGSVAGFLPGPYQAVYYASKAYVNSFSMALEEELKGSGVTVTTLCPGPTSSGFQEAAGFANPSGDSGSMSSREVAEACVRTVAAGGGLSVPGGKNKIMSYAVGLLPPTWRARLGGIIGRKRVGNP